MPQLIEDMECFLSHTHLTWDAPTVEALPGHYIWRPNLPTLRILGRTNYLNGNVALTATRSFDLAQQPIHEVFLLSAVDELIATPRIEFGDIITVGGTYQPFDVLLWPGIALTEYTGWCPGARMWKVLLNNLATNRQILQIKRGHEAFEAGGSWYRSLYQAANSICEPLMLPLAGLPF